MEQENHIQEYVSISRGYWEELKTLLDDRKKEIERLENNLNRLKRARTIYMENSILSSARLITDDNAIAEVANKYNKLMQTNKTLNDEFSDYKKILESKWWFKLFSVTM